MPKKCAVFGCSTNRHHYEVGIRFFHIPREDEDLQLRWLQAIGRSTEWKIPTIPIVCEKHFAPDQMVSKRNLAPYVVPTLNLPSPEELQSRTRKPGKETKEVKRKIKAQTAKTQSTQDQIVQEPEMVLIPEGLKDLFSAETCCRLCSEDLKMAEGWNMAEVRHLKLVRDEIWDLCCPKREEPYDDEGNEQKMCGVCWTKIKEFDNFVTVCHQQQEKLSRQLEVHLEKPSELLKNQTPETLKSTPEPMADANSELPSLEGMTIDEMLEALDKVPASSRRKNEQLNQDEECWDCGKMFPNRSQKKDHRKTCSLIGTPDSLRNRSHSCEICGKSFNSRHGLRMHLQKIHSNDPGLEENASEELKRLMSKKHLQCPLCPDRFEQLYMLKYHLKTHKTESLGNIKRIRRKKGNTITNYCELCDKTFPNPSYLGLHMKFHKRERDFPCDQCDKAFFLAHDLKHHKMAVHEAHTILCGECGKTFGTPSYFKRHMLTHNTDPDSKPFRCSYCAESFHTAVKLRDHVTRHTGERAHKCDLCVQAFRFRHQLTQHKIKKHGLQLDRMLLAKVDVQQECTDFNEEQSVDAGGNMQVEYTDEKIDLGSGLSVLNGA